MTFWDYLYGFSLTLLVFIAFIGYIGTKFDVVRINEENEQLKAEIEELRKRKRKNGGNTNGKSKKNTKK